MGLCLEAKYIEDKACNAGTHKMCVVYTSIRSYVNTVEGRGVGPTGVINDVRGFLVCIIIISHK